MWWTFLRKAEEKILSLFNVIDKKNTRLQFIRSCREKYFTQIGSIESKFQGTFVTISGGSKWLRFNKIKYLTTNCQSTTLRSLVQIDRGTPIDQFSMVFLMNNSQYVYRTFPNCFPFENTEHKDLIGPEKFQNTDSTIAYSAQKGCQQLTGRLWKLQHQRIRSESPTRAKGGCVLLVPAWRGVPVFVPSHCSGVYNDKTQ